MGCLAVIAFFLLLAGIFFVCALGFGFFAIVLPFLPFIIGVLLIIAGVYIIMWCFR